MITATNAQMVQISTIAEAAYPAECCGLLAGVINPNSGIAVTRVVPSDNVALTNTLNSFEVDPKVRFDLMRALEGTGEEIIGHYHSHPDQPAEPSATDLSMVYEPELYWLIAAVDKHATGDIKAYRILPDGSAFAPVPIRIVKE